LENGYIPLGGLFDKSFKNLPFDLIAVLFGPKDPHPNYLRLKIPKPLGIIIIDWSYLKPRFQNGMPLTIPLPNF
jgi:hypothetical protein